MIRAADFSAALAVIDYWLIDTLPMLISCTGSKSQAWACTAAGT